MAAHELRIIDAKRELVLHHLIHLRRWRNLVVPPLLRLPTELILDISVVAVKLSYRGFRFWVNLTAICHRIREMLIYSPFLWRIINADSIPLAKLFLKRCNSNPPALFVTDHLFLSRPTRTDKTEFWEELEGRTLDNLRFLMFRGLKNEFEHRVVDLLRRTQNLSTLEIETRPCLSWDFEWTLGNQLPHLTMLRLSQVRINWDAPILRNLTKLILNFACVRSPKRFTSVQTFLSVLENCPDLESLHLVSAGPVPEDDAKDGGKIVPLYKLKDLVLFFEEKQRRVMVCILSHIWFPVSTKVQIETSCRDGPLAALSQILPPPNAAIFQHLRKPTIITIYICSSLYELATDNFRLIILPECDEESYPSNLEIMPQFLSKFVEIIGGETAIALHVRFDLPYDVPRGVWKELLRGFPHLEVICIQRSGGSVDPFCSVFSEPFEGGFVCPRLRDLRVPRSFTQGSSAVTLKQALLKRGACGTRLKRISVNMTLEDEEGLLRPFRDVADEVSRFQITTEGLSSSVSSPLKQNKTLEN